jgi:hypothetical protein
LFNRQLVDKVSVLAPESVSFSVTAAFHSKYLRKNPIPPHVCHQTLAYLIGVFILYSFNGVDLPDASVFMDIFGQLTAVIQLIE